MADVRIHGDRSIGNPRSELQGRCGYLLLATLVVFVILVKDIEPYQLHFQNVNELEPNDVSESAALRIQKRSFLRGIGSLAQVGNRALKSIVGQATKIGETQTSRLYLRTGTLKTAVQDFRSVQPRNVVETLSRSKNDMEGKVGDRIIKVREYGYNSQPTLYFIRPNKRGTAKIDMFVYKKGKRPPKTRGPSVDIEDFLR